MNLFNEVRRGVLPGIALGLASSGAMLIGSELLEGCKPPPPSLGPDIATEVKCIADQYLAGVTDPVAIGVACGGAEANVVSDIIKTLDKVKASRPIALDGGK